MTAYSPPEAWVGRPRPNPGAKLRLFCFPYAGGGASTFRTWADALPTTLEVRPIQLPGREARIREPSFTRLFPLVEAIAEALVPYLDRPFVFFGHSLGALVSFETARQLRRHVGVGPAHLVVSACGAPQTRDARPPMHDLPTPQLLEELRRFNGTPREVLEHAELMQLLLPTLRADFAVHETYTYLPERPVECPISAFGGAEDPNVDPDRLERWRDQTSASFRMRLFPGGHFFIHAAQALLLRALGQELEEVAERAA
jgi:medium-chain acyl-[acyl-carrier-protein] hydrolase